MKSIIKAILFLFIFLCVFTSCKNSLEEEVPVISYTVSFDSDGGTEVSNQIVEKGNTAKVPENPTKDDCNFIGWFYEDKIFDFSSEIIDNITIKAKWEKIKFVISFNTDGGTEISNQIVEKGSTVYIPTKPSKEGYKFCDWLFEDEIFDFTTPIAKNITLKAKWEKNYYVVTFDSNEGLEICEQIISYNEPVVRPNTPIKQGYIFNGWYYKDELFDFTTSIKESITLVAKWKPITYFIAFDQNGGFGQKMTMVSLVYDEQLQLPVNEYNAPIGKVFNGWALNKDELDFNYTDKQSIKNITDINNSTVTLYAIWKEKDPHSIKYENISFNGEQIINSENPLSYYESRTIELRDIERRGYLFEGWYTDVNCTENNKITGWSAGEKTEDLIIYAKWRRNKYKISFDSCGGNEFESQTIEYNDMISFPGNPVIEGKTFMGWYKDAKKTLYYDFSQPYTDIQDVVLYAKWGSFVFVEGATVTRSGITDSSIFLQSNTVIVPSLFVCDHEITQSEYEKYCFYGETGPDEICGVGPNYPAYYVNWYDAIIYCNLRSIAEGYTPVYSVNNESDPRKWNGINSRTISGIIKYCGPSSQNTTWDKVECNFDVNGYRLPTEAEWEYIARGGYGLGGFQYKYSGSDNIDEVAWYGNNSPSNAAYAVAHEVMTKKSNLLNIYDMSGNVTEWCWNGTGQGTQRVFRGGCFGSIDSSCLVKSSSKHGPYDGQYSNGFRVVRTVTE